MFDATKAEMAGNADWVVDADQHNLNVTSGNGLGTLGGVDSNPQRTPTPAASAITSSTSETYWTGALSSWGVALVKDGYKDIQTLPYNGRISYTDGTNVQDLSNYKVVVFDEPNILFTSSEETALVRYVQNGGSLFMIADHGASDRNNDGSDSCAVWNNLYTSNSVQANPFGIHFNSDNISPTSTFVDTSTADPITRGPIGSVTQVNYNNGSTITIDPAANASVKAAVWSTSSHTNSNVMVAYATYGKGRVVAIGDSSPIDDGTGDPGDTLYPGWTTASHSTLVLNASVWLASATVAPEPDSRLTFVVGVSCLAFALARRTRRSTTL